MTSDLDPLSGPRRSRPCHTGHTSRHVLPIKYFTFFGSIAISPNLCWPHELKYPLPSTLPTFLTSGYPSGIGEDPRGCRCVSELQGDTTLVFSHGSGYDVIWPAWPRDLPSPSLIRHL